MNIKKRIRFWIAFGLLAAIAGALTLAERSGKANYLQKYENSGDIHYEIAPISASAKGAIENELIKKVDNSGLSVVGTLQSNDNRRNAESSVEEENQVTEFYNDTDRWIDAKKSGAPTVKDVETFHSNFKKLPKNRKKECLQRALNLVPDENIMLLVGVLMDKNEDKELVSMVYHDVLNRNELVKKPILQTIFKDKEHPCWADTAWILDVTGELPKKK